MNKKTITRRAGGYIYYNRLAFQVTAIYMVGSALWILFSDKLLLNNPETAVAISVVKGWAYTVVVGIFFYAVIARELNTRNIAEAKQKETETELRESEELLRESQRIAGLGSYVTDFTSGFWKSSEVLDTVFGIDSSYWRSIDGWAKLIHPDDQKMMTDYLNKEVLSNHQPFDKEYRIIRQTDKAVRWVHGIGRLEFDDEGRPLKMVGTIQDVTVRKDEENALRAKLDEIEKLNKLMVNRELKMVELKKKAETLKEQLEKK